MLNIMTPFQTKKKSNLNKLKSYNASPLYFLDWNSFLKSSDPFP